MSSWKLNLNFATQVYCQLSKPLYHHHLLEYDLDRKYILKLHPLHFSMNFANVDLSILFVTIRYYAILHIHFVLANAIQLFLIYFWNVKARDCIVFPSLTCIFFVIVGVMPNKTCKKQTPITLISNEWIIIIIYHTNSGLHIYAVGDDDDDDGDDDEDELINFMNFYKVDGLVLLWNPICKCSSVMLIFTFTLCSARKSKINFHHKFFETWKLETVWLL